MQITLVPIGENSRVNKIVSLFTPDMEQARGERRGNSQRKGEKINCYQTRIKSRVSVNRRACMPACMHMYPFQNTGPQGKRRKQCCSDAHWVKKQGSVSLFTTVEQMSLTYCFIIIRFLRGCKRINFYNCLETVNTFSVDVGKMWKEGKGLSSGILPLQSLDQITLEVLLKLMIL